MAPGLALILVLGLAGQETPDIPAENPCKGASTKPSVACQNMLTNAALTWERRYHDERSAHLTTIELCSEKASAPAPEPRDDNPKMWTYLGIGGGILALGTIIAAGVILLPSAFHH